MSHTCPTWNNRSAAAGLVLDAVTHDSGSATNSAKLQRLLAAAEAGAPLPPR